jgi:hypothetical protein
MCLKSPGPRCAAHTRPEFTNSQNDLKEVANDHRNNPTPESTSKLAQARQRFYEAWVHYSGTPQGQKELLQRINDIEDKGQDAELLWGVYDRAMQDRRKSMQASNALQMGAEPPVCRTREREVNGLRLAMTGHALRQAREKGFDMPTISAAFSSPDRVYPNGRYPGQWRVTGNGICIVGEPVGDSFEVKTMYLDGVVTKPRPDQLKTSEGAEYHRRYKQQGAGARTFR